MPIIWPWGGLCGRGAHRAGDQSFSRNPSIFRVFGMFRSLNRRSRVSGCGSTSCSRTTTRQTRQIVFPHPCRKYTRTGRLKTGTWDGASFSCLQFFCLHSPWPGAGTARPRKLEGDLPSNRFVRHAVRAWMCERSAREICFAAKARTAPRPFGSRPCEVRLDRIVLDVAHHPSEVLLIADVAVEIIVFPEHPLAAQNPVRFLGSISFPALEDFAQGHLPDLNEGVDVIGHHDPGQEPILHAIVMP